MKKALYICLVLALAVPALAGDPKIGEFKASPHDVFTAAVRSAQKNWAVKFADEKSGVITFTSGISMTSNGMECSALVEPMSDGGTRVTLRTAKKAQLYAWGVGGRIAKKFFEGIDKELAK
jgi:hypothetical protein